MEAKETIVEETKQTNYEVDVRNIKPLQRAGGNIRTDYGDIDELAASIEQNGIKVPLRAFRDKDNAGQWFAIDGHRRLTAAMKLVNEKGLSIRAKVIVEDARKISDEQIIYDMVTTNSGKSLSPIEMAEAVRRLIGYGHTPKEIALKFGKSTRFVNHLNLLANCPKRIRDLMANNQISFTLVLHILRETADFNEALQLIERSLGAAKATVYEDGETQIEDDEPFGKFAGKATKKHLDIATNRVVSIKELQRLLKRQIDTPKPLNPINAGIFDFAKKLLEDKYTCAEMEKLFFTV